MIKLIGEEFLDEMATVYRSSKYCVQVAVNPDSKRKGNPYFKFYNAVSRDKATKVIRILFRKPDYVIHTDSKKIWKLNSSDKKLLMKILNEPSSYYKNVNTWNAAKFDWNRESLEENFYIEDYLNGEYDNKFKDNINYLSSNLKMPDYTQIQF